MHTLVPYYWITHHQESVSIYWLLENIHYSHNVQALQLGAQGPSHGGQKTSRGGVEPERYGNSEYFPITNKYLLFVDYDVSSNTILEYA